MEEMIANERSEENKSEAKKTYFGKENFRMYYALGPGLEDVHKDCEKDIGDKYEDCSADLDEDVSDNNTDDSVRNHKLSDDSS